MAACQVPMDAIDPCAAFSSIGTIVASVVDLGLRVTLSNMFTNCSYIPFLVRWDLVPPYPFGSDDLDEKNNGYAWGLAGGQSQIVTGVAVLIGGTLVYYLSFQTLFITMGVFQVIATLVQSRILFAEKTFAFSTK